MAFLAGGDVEDASGDVPHVFLRQWQQSDLASLIALNSDPEVMKFFPRTLSASESREMLVRLQRGIAEQGWGLWAVEVAGVCAGFTGLARPTFQAHFTPCVEIGWRLRCEYWGKSIAFAAARQALDFAFTHLKLAEVVSFTSTANVRSQRLMQRLGFSHTAADDFLHPALAENDSLCPHVLYRLRRPPTRL